MIAAAAKIVLVIDDEPPVRATLRDCLEDAGYEVLEAANGDEGMQLMAERPVALVITDILMPEKEGIETILDVRRAYPGVPIIAMSGGGRTVNQDYLAIAEKLGADSVLAKPFRPDRLLGVVAELLARDSAANDKRAANGDG